jgi:Rab GDP dissociation inhibitor
MGLFEKRSFRDLLLWANKYDENDPKTHKNIPPNTRMIDAFKKFGLNQDTIDFTGHALALYSDDE